MAEPDHALSTGQAPHRPAGRPPRRDPQSLAASNAGGDCPRWLREALARRGLEPGVPDKRRSNYVVWREGKAPDFVLEIFSPSTRTKDIAEKPALYRRMGVREYSSSTPTAAPSRGSPGGASRPNGERRTRPRRGMRWRREWRRWKLGWAGNRETKPLPVASTAGTAQRGWRLGSAFGARRGAFRRPAGPISYSVVRRCP